MESLVLERQRKRLVRNRAAFGIVAIYLAVFGAFFTRHEWTRLWTRPLPVTAEQLERLDKEEPSRRRFVVRLDGMQRTDVFRDDDRGSRVVSGARYWALPVGKRFLLVRSEPMAKLPAEISGALSELDAKDRRAMAEIDWLTVYRRARVPGSSRAKLIPYVFVTPYDPQPDLAIVVVLAILALVGLSIWARAALRGPMRFVAPLGERRREVDAAWEDTATIRFHCLGAELRVGRDWAFGTSGLGFFAVPLSDVVAVGERLRRVGPRELSLRTSDGLWHDIRVPKAEFTRALSCLAVRAPHAFATRRAA